jgi:hypothetical protein
VANTLTGLVPTIYEALDEVQREFIGIIPAVTRDSGIERAAKGQTITSSVAPAASASDITPGVTAPNDGDQVFGTFNVSLDNAKYVPIRWNGEEQRSLAAASGGIGANNLLRNQFAQAFRTLANLIETDVVAKAYKAASRATGTAAQTPFGTSGDLSDAANVMQILDDNGAPMDRHLILGSAAMAKVRGIQGVLFKANEAGTDELLRQGTIGLLEGMRVGYSAGVKTVTKGTGTGYLVNNVGPYAIGATTIELDTGTGTVLAGDVVTFAGDTNKYVVVSPIGAGTSIVIGSPGLRQTLANNVAMTIGGSYTPNVAFSKSGIILATRAPAVPVDSNGRAADMADDQIMVTDPGSGISFEVSLYRQYKQLKYEVGLVWGAAVVKQDYVATLLG